MKAYRPWQPDQSHLLPPAPQDWLPEGHLAFFIIDVVRELDLSTITRAIDTKDARGVKPYSPVMMTALLLYAYCVGVFSSRRIERATYEDVAFRVLTAGEHPSFGAIAAFRRRHIQAFTNIFKQTVALCQQAGMVELGLVALDGTKMQGNASKHKAMSYERMLREEERLDEEVKQLLRCAEQTDRDEDQRFGQGQRQEDLPAELRRREGRLDKIRAAKRALEEQARHARVEVLESRAEAQDVKAATEDDPAERKRAAARARKARQEADEIAKDFDDDEPPPSMGQAVVDAKAQVIVAQGVTNQPPDNHHLQPMLEQTAQNTGRLPAAAAADAGYWACENAEYGDSRGVDLYISTRRARHGQSPRVTPDDDSPRSRMARKLESDPGRALYARRKAVVEPVFGQVKEARGFRRFLLRGIRKVGGEWAMLTATHNLLKLFRHAMPAAPA